MENIIEIQTQLKEIKEFMLQQKSKITIALQKTEQEKNKLVQKLLNIFDYKTSQAKNLEKKYENMITNIEKNFELLEKYRHLPGQTFDIPDEIINILITTDDNEEKSREKDTVESLTNFAELLKGRENILADLEDAAEEVIFLTPGAGAGESETQRPINNTINFSFNNNKNDQKDENNVNQILRSSHFSSTSNGKHPKIEEEDKEESDEEEDIKKSKHSEKHKDDCKNYAKYTNEFLGKKRKLNNHEVCDEFRNTYKESKRLLSNAFIIEKLRPKVRILYSSYYDYSQLPKIVWEGTERGSSRQQNYKNISITIEFKKEGKFNPDLNSPFCQKLASYFKNYVIYCNEDLYEIYIMGEAKIPHKEFTDLFSQNDKFAEDNNIANIRLNVYMFYEELMAQSEHESKHNHIATISNEEFEKIKKENQILQEMRGCVEKIKEKYIPCIMSNK
jgi:hypothetical protein